MQCIAHLHTEHRVMCQSLSFARRIEDDIRSLTYLKLAIETKLSSLHPQPPESNHPHDMNTNHETEVHDANSDINSNINSDISSDSTNPMPTTPAPQALQALPAELIGILAEMLDSRDLLAMRATCRELREGSELAFCQQFLASIAISGTRNSVRQLIAVVTSPNHPHAQQTVRNLVVRASLAKPSEGHSESDAIDVTCLLQSMPKLTAIELIGEITDASSTRPSNVGSTFLTCIADSCLHATSHLSRLDLYAVRLDDHILSDCLETHKHSLRTVSLKSVTLASILAWDRVLESLHSSETEDLELIRPQYESVIETKEIGRVPFPRQIIENFMRNALRADGGAADRGSVATCLRGVKATHDWVKPVLGIMVRYLKGEYTS